MNKQELVATVAARTSHPKAQVADTVTVVLEVIQDTLAGGGEVSFIGFGTFKTKERAGRSGFNALAGRVVTVSDKRVAVFKPGSVLAAAVNTVAERAA